MSDQDDNPYAAPKGPAEPPPSLASHATLVLVLILLVIVFLSVLSLIR